MKGLFAFGPAGLAALALLAATPAFAQTKAPRDAAPPGAKVFFVEPAEGATVPPRFKVKFGVSGIALSPAGAAAPGTGHHHLIVDTDLPPFDEKIPADFNHLHYGAAQTEAEISLPPGDHTLQLLLGDKDHVPHDPPIYSAELHIKVAEKPPETALPETASSGRRPSPPDAAVYFITPRNGGVIYPRSIVRFGLRNMGVAPAGVVKAGTGHHHLIIDAPTPALDQPIPNDFNNLHFGKGQTEKRVDLKPGRHTLQLVFADERHVPHDPPIVSERIDVVVKVPVKPKKPKQKPRKNRRR